MVRPIRHILGLGGILAFAAVLLPAGPWPAAAQISTVGTSGVGPFTQEQVDSGRVAYNANCAACHGYDLQNGTHRTSLIGPGFIAGWGTRTTWEYYRYVSYRMPDRAPGSLAPQTYSAIIAYILAANGAQPGNETMTPQSAVRIDTIADGIVRESVLAGNSQPQ
jgi:mono/diheme cytochrome c family protein